MSRKFLRAAAAAVAGAALVVGPMAGAGAGAGAQAGQAQLPVLIGDSQLETYATYSEVSIWQDAYVRMLPLSGSTASGWEFRDSTAGGTAIVHLDTGGCLQLDRDSAELYVEVSGCARDAGEGWEVRTGEEGTVFVHLQTETCLTRAVKGPGEGVDPRLTLAKCHGGEAQLFSLVV
ncbi:RICIN domain-containing protein [Streptomyces sp. 6N223]|uniref:RICIN domain-containing protein n=1 Tax=Streptomyces sp. 6N223 TaxID=3457412 RepID=UPI003FD4C385